MTDVQVIVATHDRPQMLEVALHSILASAAMVPETVRVLVVDDASETRGAEAVAERCRVDYVRNPQNLGVAAALARGWDLTDSKYVSFWGDDDFMMPRHLPVHLALIRQGFDAVYGHYFFADGNLRIVREQRLPMVRFADLMRLQVNATDVSLFRRSALPPWRPERGRAMLLTMWLALTSAGHSIGQVKEATWLYRRHAEQLSHTPPTGRDLELRMEAVDEYRAVPA